MKAAIIQVAGGKPIYGDFAEPVATEGAEIIAVKAAALSQFSKARSAGSHYSSDAEFPVIAGADGVGVNADGRRVYFVLPSAPYGSLAEKALVRPKLTVPVPDNLDDVTAAALANPGMSACASLVERAVLKPGETVLINGATGTAGRLAVQIAKHLGAGKVIATGRNEAELEELKAIGADVIVPFTLGLMHPTEGKHYEEAIKAAIADGVNVVVDYLWGQSRENCRGSDCEKHRRRDSCPLRPRRGRERRRQHRPSRCCAALFFHSTDGQRSEKCPSGKTARRDRECLFDEQRGKSSDRHADSTVVFH